MVKMTNQEMTVELEKYPSWKFDEKTNHLSKTFEFKTYFQTLAFVNAVGWLAQKLKHHPDLFVTYGKCRIDLQTHDVAGISKLDFTLIDDIEKIA